MKYVVTLLVWMSVAAAGVGFVLPWALIDLRQPQVVRRLQESGLLGNTLSGLTKDLGRITARVRRGAETVTGELPSLSDIPRQVSGVQIPQMVNQKNAQVAIALVELFTHERQQLGSKSYAVYLLPGLALLCGLLLSAFGAKPPVAIGVALVCAAIAAAGFWKLLTTNTETLFVAITIGQGLWLSLWGYVGLAIAAVLRLVFKGVKT